MKKFALVFLLLFFSTACVQPKAEDSYKAGLKELQLKADALQAVADIANAKVKAEPTPENKAAADAANIAAAHAVMDVAIYTVPAAVEAYSSKPASGDTPEPDKKTDKIVTSGDLSTDDQYTPIVVLTDNLFFVGKDAADMSTSIKNLGPKNRQIDVSVCGFHVSWKTVEKLTNELNASGYNRIGFATDGDRDERLQSL